MFNRLVRLRNRAENAWAQVDVQLRKRYDLIPNLVETVKGYAAHERGTFEAVTEARVAAQKAQGVAEQAQAENVLTQALGRLFAAAAAYSLPAAEINVRVAPNGALLVDENITIAGAYHGAYRDIPLRKGESIDRIQVSEQGERYARGGSTKLGSIDTPHTFNYELHKDKVRIVWHFSAGGEPHTYSVAYRFRGLAVAYSDIVDVNLKVWGANWSAPLGDLTATMTL